MVDRLLVGLAELPVFVVTGGGDRQQPGATAAALMQSPRERVVRLPFPLAVKKPPFVHDRGARVDAVAEPPVRGEQLVEAVSLLAAQHTAGADPVGELALLDPAACEALCDPGLVFGAGNPVHLGRV